MDRKIINIIESLRTQGYTPDIVSDKSGKEYIVFRANITVSGKSYECDTAFYIDFSFGTGTKTVTFSTLIHQGVAGSLVNNLYRVIEYLNYHLYGKLVIDYTDRSGDILYVTSEFFDNLSENNTANILLHHAKVKQFLLPLIESLVTQLGLVVGFSNNDSDKYALAWTQKYLEAFSSQLLR